jgi:hypothetical protein
MNCSLLRFFSLSASLSIVLSLLVAACSGGESGTGFGGSYPKVSVGVITGFGSVFVNGVEFDTSRAEINVNEAIASEEDLAIGMVVSVVGSTDPSQVSGSADAIYYESEVCGIVNQNDQPDQLEIMGQTVKYDSETVFDSSIDTVASVAEIPVGAVVEITGYRTGDNSLHATQITLLQSQYNDGEQLIVNGVVTAGVSSGKFSMGTLTVVVDDVTQFINLPNNQITPGMAIKVKSKRGLVNTNELLADQIQLNKNQYVVAGNVLEIEGIVMNPNLQANEFQLNGYTVYFSAQTRFVDGAEDNLADGVKVEVEGVLLSDNQLEAGEITFRKSAKIDLIAPVTSINIADNQVNLSGVNVRLTNRTLLKDDDRITKIRQFSLEDLSDGDRVKIKAFRDNLTQQIIAIQFRRVAAQSADSTFEITGILDELNNAQAIIAGVAVDTAGLSPVLTNADVGTDVTVVGTIPISTQ